MGGCTVYGLDPALSGKSDILLDQRPINAVLKVFTKASLPRALT